jgi:hypothetical protein
MVSRAFSFLADGTVTGRVCLHVLEEFLTPILEEKGPKYRLFQQGGSSLLVHTAMWHLGGPKLYTEMDGQAAKSQAHPLPPTLHYVISPLGVHTGRRLHSATAYHV